MDLMKMLIWNLGHQPIKDVQNIAQKVIKKQRFSLAPSYRLLADNEDWWWDWPMCVSASLKKNYLLKKINILSKYAKITYTLKKYRKI